jgi:hypothetical protein
LTPYNAARFSAALKHLIEHRESIFIPCPEAMKARTLSVAIREALVWFAQNPQHDAELALLHGCVRVKTLRDGAQVDIWNREAGEYSPRMRFSNAV